MGDGRVDVPRFLRDADPPVFRQVMQRAHVVQAVGELDQDDADVVDHRQQHLAEALRLPLLARCELQPGQLRHAFDDVRHLLAEQLAHLAQSCLACLRRCRAAARRRWRPRPAACRPADRPPRAGARGRARRIGAPVPCARRPRTRRPAAAARCRRPDWPRAPSRADPRSESWGGPKALLRMIKQRGAPALPALPS